jgi:hypothetical protein
MSIEINNPAIKKLALSVAGIPLLKKLEKASRDITLSQDRVLKGIIQSCKDTLFGKEHGFASIKSIGDYRKAVPIRDYEGHRGYIDRMSRGEVDVLFPGKPVFYNTTSGTTDKPKLIPVSDRYFREAYNGISKLWFYTCLRDNPTLFHGKNLSLLLLRKRAGQRTVHRSVLSPEWFTGIFPDFERSLFHSISGNMYQRL